MFLAAEEAAAPTSLFNTFDLFMIAWTILIALGLYRILRSPKRNPFAIAFAGVSLLVFMFMDVIMIQGW
ncbi:hypothetical protein ACFFK0_01170 [Paenibacillus chartarius]|uniref:DUF2759 domain-containing protein n=1 Tax=Paenibacillus chartarius TaxID=747481 RepID=A0ABV6DEM3_9BACL